MRVILEVNAKENTDAKLQSKVAVFWLLKRKVYSVTVSNTQTATLLPIIREKIKPDSIVYTDCYKSNDALDVREFSHFRINHSRHFAEQYNHINGIENFWKQAKRYSHSFKYNSKCCFGIPLN